MKFRQALGSRNVLVADQVTLAFDISAVKQTVGSALRPPAAGPGST